ncbi:MAG TPA: permease-like cell division protein FtsX [Candidatus Limnocylindria bacterium]|nr:permease-like cell division protein FtsX [Candidatus Limnocylindria bacterium]
MHLFYLREASRSFRHHRGLAYTAILSLTAALTLSGVFLLLTHNAEHALATIGDRREMVVYLRDDVTPSQRDVLIGRLNDLYGTAAYVTKEQAWKEFQQQIGDPELLESVDDNPLPASLRVRLKPELLNHEAMAVAANQVSQFPEVEDVRYGAEWVQRLDQVREGLLRGTLAVGIVVALAIMFVIYNTIRLTVLARRLQVEIMSRLGATDGFIASPFVVEAVFEALLSAVAALAVLFALQQAMSAKVFSMAFFPASWALAFVAVTVALAWLAATLALSRVLRAVGP